MKERKAKIVFLLALTAVALYFCWVISKPFIEPIISAAIIAVVFFPIHQYFQRLIRRPNLSATVSTLSVVFLFFVPAVILGVFVSREIKALYQFVSQYGADHGGLMPSVSKYLDWAMQFVGRYVDPSRFDLRAAALNLLNRLGTALPAQVAGVLGNFTGFLVEAIIAFFTLFFFFRDGRAMWRRLGVMLPLESDQLVRLTNGISATLTASVYGVLAVGLAQGALTSFAFWVLGIHSPIFWGLVTAVFSLIPLVGSGIVWFPAAIFLLLSGHWVKGVLLLAWGGGVVSMTDNVVRPLVLSGGTKMHGLLTFFALLGGVQAFGLIGLFVGPVVLAVTTTLFGILREEARAWRDDVPDEDDEQPKPQPGEAEQAGEDKETNQKPRTPNPEP